jgi:tetratricopeptide (TPR) repeat protein
MLRGISGIRERRGSKSRGPAGLSRCLCVVAVLTAWLPAVATSGSQSTSGDGRQALEAAVALVQQGKLGEADRQAQRALADPQTRAVAHSILGTIRLQQNRLDESVALLGEAIRLEPRLVGAQLTLAQVYALQNRPDLALARFRKVLELDPDNPPARLALARSEVEKGDYAQALKLTEPVHAALRGSAEGLYVIAAALLKTGRREEAARLAADWSRVPDVPQEASIAFGLLLVQGGAIDEGTAVLEGARTAGPPTYELAFNLAGAYVMKKDAVRALEQYDAALTIRPDALDALRLAAGLAERNGELERSLSYWLRAKKLAPDDPDILLGFGRVCFKMDLLDDAEPALAKAASLKPGDIPYQYTLAAVKVGKRQYDEARSLLGPLVEAHPADAHLRYAIGTVLYTQGHLQEAAEHLRASIRLEPDQLPSHYYLALVARDEGRHEEAIAMLETLLGRHPDHAASCEALGGLLMSAGRYEEAERLLRKATELNPSSVRANYQLGLLLARTGRKEEAARQLAHAKELRQDEEASSRLQLRLLDPDRVSAPVAGDRRP